MIDTNKVQIKKVKNNDGYMWCMKGVEAIVNLL